MRCHAYDLMFGIGFRARVLTEKRQGWPSTMAAIGQEWKFGDEVAPP